MTAAMQRRLFTGDGSNIGRPKRDTTIRVEVGRRSAWLHGTGVYAAPEKTQVPRMRCPRERCWTVPIDRLGDVLVQLEYGQRRRVVLVEVDR